MKKEPKPIFNEYGYSLRLSQVDVFLIGPDKECTPSCTRDKNLLQKLVSIVQQDGRFSVRDFSAFNCAPAYHKGRGYIGIINYVTFEGESPNLNPYLSDCNVNRSIDIRWFEFTQNGKPNKIQAKYFS